MSERLNWPQTWMAMAHVMARRGRCDRSTTGVVIVTSDERLASTGYNGPPAGWNKADPEDTCRFWCERARSGGEGADEGYLTCPSIHGEANALLYASRREIEGGTIYVTRVPCFDCSKLISNSGLRAVHYVMDDPADASRPTGVSIKMMHDSGLELTAYAGREVTLRSVRD